MMIDKKNEPELVYGHAFDHYLVEVWNQRITYPNKDIYAFDDDVKGSFRHLRWLFMFSACVCTYRFPLFMR